MPTPPPYTALLLGATGNVGGCLAQLLIDSPLCKKLVLVTRRKTGAFAHAKVSEVVVEMDRMAEQLAPHAQGADMALAAFGVGKGTAKLSPEELRKIEVTYPAEFCRAARAGGARVGAVMTAVGVDPASRVNYLKVIGQKEEAVRAVGFDFLGMYRPSVILGNANTPDALGHVMRLFNPLTPSKFRAIDKNDIARAMLVQSKQAYAALAQGTQAAPVVKILEYREMRALAVMHRHAI